MDTPITLHESNPMDSLYELQEFSGASGGNDSRSSGGNDRNKAIDEPISPNLLQVDFNLIWSFRKVIFLSLLISCAGFFIWL